MIRILLTVLLAEIFATAGQVFFKKGSNAVPAPHLKSLRSYGDFIWRILCRPAVWSGFVLMTVSLLVWLAAISQGELSLVHPLGSVYYILILLSARIFLGEKIDRARLLGTALIMVGIALITLSGNGAHF